MKKTYETPEVTKVQFDASDRITASLCTTVKDPVIDLSCNAD